MSVIVLAISSFSLLTLKLGFQVFAKKSKPTEMSIHVGADLDFAPYFGDNRTEEEEVLMEFEDVVANNQTDGEAEKLQGNQTEAEKDDDNVSDDDAEEADTSLTGEILSK
jgi:hypothetical protein